MNSEQTPGQRLVVVEFLKGFSIFTIVVMHYLMPLSMPGLIRAALPALGAGVHLFIVLSGLGLYLSHLKRPMPIGRFLRRRFSRIYLPYIAVLLFVAAVSAALSLYPNSWYALFGHIFLYKMFDESIVGSYGYHLWFLSTIIQFYFAFPLLAFIKSRVSNPVFLTVGVITSSTWILLIYFAGHADDRVWNSFFLAYLWEFNVGMLLADRVMAKPSTIDLPPYAALVGAAVVGGGLYGLLAKSFGELGKLVNDAPGVVAYSAVGLLTFHFAPTVIRRFFLLTGALSFPLYLVHMVVFDAAAKAISSFHIDISITVVVLIFVATWLLAALLQRLFDFFRQACSRSRQPSASPTNNLTCT